MPSIFVQIATYHDYELSKTITNAIQMSSKKHTLNFGVSLCYYETNDIEMLDLPNIKYTLSKAPENIGLGIGRMIAHKHYSGEDYYLQVDSHSRFDQDWDDYLISEVLRFQDMGLAKPLLTCYPKGYKYVNNIEQYDDPGRSTIIDFTENREQFASTLIPTQRAYVNTNHGIFSKSVSGGSIFTIGGFIKPNMRIAFYGEEIFIAARAYTNGFDLVVPSHTFMSHLYFDHADPENSKRRLIWNDFINRFSIINQLSTIEIKRMFAENLVGEFHLGTERSLHGYEVYSGLNFSTGEITEC